MSLYALVNECNDDAYQVFFMNTMMYLTYSMHCYIAECGISCIAHIIIDCVIHLGKGGVRKNKPISMILQFLVNFEMFLQQGYCHVESDETTYWLVEAALLKR